MRDDATPSERPPRLSPRDSPGRNREQPRATPGASGSVLTRLRDEAPSADPEFRRRLEAELLLGGRRAANGRRAVALAAVAALLLAIVLLGLLDVGPFSPSDVGRFGDTSP